MAKFLNECVDLIYADPPFFSNQQYEIARRMSIFESAKLTRPDVELITLDDYVGKARLSRDMTLTSVRISPIPFGEIKVE